MLVVETIAKIRRAFFRQGKPIKAICRELGVSRKVVRKVIRSGATEFRYEREVQPLPKIGRWSDELDRLLTANEGKLPEPPDFSAETHKRFRNKLTSVVELAKAGDLKGLLALEINPVSSSPKAIARYRDLCVIALEAQAAR